MRHTVAAIVFLLAACASAPESAPPPLGPAPGAIRAQFPPGDARDVIAVTVNHRSAARGIELVLPDGQALPAYTVETRQGAQERRGAPGAAPAPGVAPGTPIPLGGIGAPTTTSVVAETLTTAFIRIPDLVDYRLNWRDYRIRLRLGDPPDRPQTITLDAPAPG